MLVRVPTGIRYFQGKLADTLLVTVVGELDRNEPRLAKVLIPARNRLNFQVHLAEPAVGNVYVCWQLLSGQ